MKKPVAVAATKIVPSIPDNGNRTWIGIVLVVLATLIFSMQDAMTKTLVVNYPVTFIIMVRYWAFLLAGLFMVMKASGGFKANIKSKRPVVQCLRGLLLMSELILLGMAFKMMGLAEATAIFEAYPLFGTLFAIFLLKEQVGWRRLSALVIGFAGILIILRPGMGVASSGAPYAVAGCICFALYMALTRMVGGVDKPATSFFYVGIVGMVIMTSGLPFFWVSMDASHIWMLVSVCCTSILGHFLMIKALTYAPLTIIQPFNYLQLVWSVIVGYIVFKGIPDFWTFVGAIIVVGSGLFVFFREQIRARQVKRIKTR